jgi:hypothetical protein
LIHVVAGAFINIEIFVDRIADIIVIICHCTTVDVVIGVDVCACATTGTSVIVIICHCTTVDVVIGIDTCTSACTGIDIAIGHITGIHIIVCYRTTLNVIVSVN